MNNYVDIAISFDTTGSMSTALATVRNNSKDLVNLLYDTIPNLRISVIAHGDYIDGKNWLNYVDLTEDKNKVLDFINIGHRTQGGDADECYEQVLKFSRSLSWTSSANKALIVIGDCEPHPVGYRNSWSSQNGLPPINQVDWRQELETLKDIGIVTYGVKALNNSTGIFYKNISDIHRTPKLKLVQFEDIVECLIATCFSHNNSLSQYESLNRPKSRYTQDFVNSLAGRKTKEFVSKYKEVGLIPVDPSRFQTMKVKSDTSIKDFIVNKGLLFKQGRGFYELTVPVLVQENKEVVVQDKDTLEMFTGPDARKMIGLEVGERAKVKPVSLDKYNVFIQSTSNNRKLLKNTKFLYECVE